MEGGRVAMIPRTRFPGFGAIIWAAICIAVAVAVAVAMHHDLWAAFAR